MSKKHGHRKKRRSHQRPGPVRCPRCHSPGDGSPGALLKALAACLNTAEDSGAKVRVRRDYILLEGAAAGGFVLADFRGRWHSGPLIFDPDAPAPRGDDMDD